MTNGTIKKLVSDRGFVASDRLDVDQLAGERDGIHGGENSRGERGARQGSGGRGASSLNRAPEIGGKIRRKTWP